MRLGDVIVAHVPSGSWVLDETPPSLELSKQFAEVDQVTISPRSAEHQKPAAQVRAWVSNERDAPSSERLGELLSGVAVSLKNAFPDVGDFIEGAGPRTLLDLGLIVAEALNSTDRGLRHVLLVNPAPNGMAREVLAACNENRMLWMLYRGQSTRLRQLRGRLRENERELERLESERGRGDNLEEKIERLTEALEQARRTVVEERDRANRAEQARLLLADDVERRGTGPARRQRSPSRRAGPSVFASGGRSRWRQRR